MAVAGFCEACQKYVFLNDQWGCVSGHPWNQIHTWYDPDTGTAITPYWLEPGYSPAPQTAPAPEVAASAPATPQAAPVAVPVQPAAQVPVAAPAGPADRLTLLAAVLETFGRYPGYNLQYGTDTDVVIDNQIANASWVGGKKKIEYSAILKAVEAEHTVYFWEILKESGAGLSFGGMESESYSTFGTKRSGKTKQVVLGPDGVEINAEWDYAATRKIVEAVAAERGWRVKTVLRKRAAQW